MKDIVFRELPLPVVTLDDVYKAEGANYSKRSPSAVVVELHQRMLEEAPQWIEPKAIWREVDILGVDGDNLLLEGGKSLKSDVLTKVTGTADKLVIFAVTIGEKIEEGLKEYETKGNMAEIYVLDAVASAYLSKAIDYFQSELEESYHNRGLKTTFTLGPGHSYWEGLEDMQVIFEYLEAEKINIRLNATNLMIPRKSLAVVMGAGLEIPDTEGKTHCHFCHLHESCSLSEARNIS